MFDWGQTPIGDVSHRVTKGTTPKMGGFTQHGVSFVKVESITGEGIINPAKLAHINEETNRLLARSILRADDLLFSIAGTIGRVARVTPAILPANTNQALAIIRPDRSKVDVGYLLYCLRDKNRIQEALSLVVQSVQANLSLSELSAIEIPLPPMSVQRSIAGVLGALDDKIAANNILSNTASDLMVSMLTPYPSNLPLSEIVVHRRKSSNPESILDENVAHFSLPAFDTGMCPEICNPLSIKSNKFLIEKPSVLISKLNPRFPRIWDVATLPNIPALASTEFLVLEPKSESTAVIWSMLSQPSFSASLESQVSGTSNSHQRVKPDDLLATLVPDPGSVPIVVRRLISGLGSRIASARIENLTLAETRDALLPQLMSGKLRVNDAEKVLEDAGV